MNLRSSARMSEKRLLTLGAGVLLIGGAALSGILQAAGTQVLGTATPWHVAGNFVWALLFIVGALVMAAIAVGGWARMGWRKWLLCLPFAIAGIIFCEAYCYVGILNFKERLVAARDERASARLERTALQEQIAAARERAQSAAADHSRVEAAEAALAKHRAEIAVKIGEANAMDHDGDARNDARAIGLLAEAESLKADLPDLQSRVREAEKAQELTAVALWERVHLLAEAETAKAQGELAAAAGVHQFTKFANDLVTMGVMADPQRAEMAVLIGFALGVQALQYLGLAGFVMLRHYDEDLTTDAILVEGAPARREALPTTQEAEGLIAPGALEAFYQQTFGGRSVCERRSALHAAQHNKETPLPVTSKQIKRMTESETEAAIKEHIIIPFLRQRMAKAA